MIDFKKARLHAKKAMDNRKLQIIIMGHQGSGKSYCIGTLGTKTLYLFGTKEAHGPTSAQTEGGDNIEPMCFDYGVWHEDGEDAKPRQWTGDESHQFLSAILRDYDFLREEKYGAIVIDGLSVLEAMVKDTTIWRDKCKTASGKHNTFRETEASQEMVGELLSKLKQTQQEIDCHVVVTGILDVKEKDGFGAVIEASPRLAGYGLAETLLQHMADIVVVGKMTKNNEAKYKFQFMTDLTKASKDEHGNLKKAMNFSPRLTGCAPPPVMDANLSKLAEMKAAKK